MSDFVNQWQSDVVGRIEGDTYFDDLIVIQERLGTTEAEVDEALKTFRTEGSKKPGAAVIVMMPERKRYGMEIQLRSDLIFTIRVIELPKINRLTGGSNKWASAISNELEDLLHAWTVGAVTLMLESTEPYNDGEGGIGFTLMLKVLFARGLTSRVSSPGISVSTGTATITIPSGASVYYTTDGSFPIVSNTNATLYSAPFAVSVDTMIRAVAYKTGFQASDLASLIT